MVSSSYVRSRDVERTWSMSTVLGLVFFVTLVIPSISYVGHGLVTTWVVFVFWLLAILLEYPHIIRQVGVVARGRRIELFMFAGWLLLIIANYSLGRAYAGKAHAIAMITFAMIIVMDLVYTALGKSIRKSLAIALFLMLGIEVIRSLPALWSLSFIVRNVMYQGGSSQIYAEAFLSGVGEYSLYTGCAIILPVILATVLESRGWLRAGLMTAWMGILVAILLATLMGAILLALTGFILLLIFVVTSSRQKMHLILLLSVIGLAIIVSWFALFKDTEHGQIFADKFARQFTSMRDKGMVAGDLTNRADLWQKSIDTFLANPIFGIGPVSETENPYIGYLVGGHSSLLDLPAEYGIVGFVLYLGFLLTAMRRAFISLRRTHNRLFSKACIVSALLFLVSGCYNPIIFVTTANLFLYFFALGGLQPSPITINAAAFRSHQSVNHLSWQR